MPPPAFAEALVAAAAPSRDYETIVGDLCEEYGCIVSSSGRSAANRWYWAQALRSLPSLLSYSASERSSFQALGVALTAFGVLVTMLVAITAFDIVSQKLFGIGGIPRCVSLCINYGDALGFGAILAAIVRNDGPRVAFFTSLFLVLCFVIPALAGNPHSQAPPATWIQLFGVIPAMSAGAAVYQAVKCRIRSV
jgi:hypothetical protein